MAIGSLLPQLQYSSEIKARKSLATPNGHPFSLVTSAPRGAPTTPKQRAGQYMFPRASSDAIEVVDYHADTIEVKGFDLDLMRPGALMQTNPESRFSMGLEDYHMMFEVDYARRIIFPPGMILPGNTPEDQLKLYNKDIEGLATIYLFGSKEDQPSNFDLRSGFLLGPGRQHADGGFSVLLSTARQNIRPELQYKVVGMPMFNFPSPSLCYEPVNGFPDVETALGEELWKMKGVLLPLSLPWMKIWHTQDWMREAHGVKRKVVPRPHPCPATAAYPAIRPPSDDLFRDAFDGQLCRIPVEADEFGQVFPWQRVHSWFEGEKKEFLVPCHEPLDAAAGTIVTLSGISGGVSVQDAKDIYGQATDDGAQAAAARLNQDFVRQGRYVVSAGDVVAYDGRYFAHRASSSRGNSGGALRPVDRPGLFYGMHLEAGGMTPPVQYSIALSCNHPLFVLWYVKEAVPDLLLLTGSDWVDAYQPAALKTYLQHHQQLLEASGLWDQAAATFVAEH